MWVRYKCNLCGKDDKATVRERRDGEHVGDWLRDAVAVVGVIHAATGCQADKVDLMIPAQDERGIGFGTAPDPGHFLTMDKKE